MKPEDALAFLDQAVAQISGSRQLHVQLHQAIECLQASIAGLTQPKDNSTQPKEDE